MRPELLTSRGDTLAAQASLAYNMLRSPDVFYAAMERGVSFLTDNLTEMRGLLSQELSAQSGSTVQVKTTVPTPTVASLDGMISALSERSSTKVYLKQRRTKVEKLVQEISTWVALSSPKFSAMWITPDVLAPVLDKVQGTGDETLAASLQAALEVKDTWNQHGPVYTGTLTPDSTRTPPEVALRSGPFTFAAAATITVGTGVSDVDWVVPVSTKPTIVGPKSNVTLSAGVKPTLTFTTPFTTLVETGISVTVSGSGQAVAALATFINARRGMLLKLGVFYYVIENVVSTTEVWLTTWPTPGVYWGPTVHTERTFPITLSVPSQDIYGETYTVDLLTYGTHTEAEVAAAFTTAMPAGVVVAYDTGWVSITIDEYDTDAEIDTDGTVSVYPTGYDAIGVVPGASTKGTPDNSLVTVTYRSVAGVITTAAVALTPGTYTPTTLAGELTTKFPLAMTSVLGSGGHVELTGKVAGGQEMLEVTLNGTTYKAWGEDSILPDPPTPLTLIRYEPLVVGPEQVQLDGTTTVLISSSLLAQVTASWVVEVRLVSEKHWAAYRIVTLNEDNVELDATPGKNLDEVMVRLTYSPYALTNATGLASAVVSVETSADAAELGISGEESVGNAASFTPATGISSGYVVRGDSGEEYTVVSSGDVITLSGLDIEATPFSSTVYSPGALRMITYSSLQAYMIKNPVLTPSFIKDDIAAAVSNIDACLAIISATSSYEAIDSAELNYIVDFVNERELELLTAFLRYGAVTAFLAAERGSMRNALSTSSMKDFTMV